MEPNIDAKTGTEVELVPTGRLVAMIDSFEGIKESRIREGLYYLRIKLDTQFGPVWTYLAGYAPTLEALKLAEPFYKGKKILIKVEHREFQGRLYASAIPIWTLV